MDMNKLYAKILAKRFIRVLVGKGWKYATPHSNQDLFLFGLQYEQAIKLQCFFDISLDKSHCVLYLRREQQIAENNHNKVAEYLTYANYGLVLGNFEFDLNDGEVRYKASLPAGKRIGFLFSALPSKRELQHIVDVSVSTMVRYCKGINSLLDDPDLLPKQACMQIEKHQSVSAADVIAQIDKLSADEKKLVEAKLRESD